MSNKTTKTKRKEAASRFNKALAEVNKAAEDLMKLGCESYIRVHTRSIEDVIEGEGMFSTDYLAYHPPSENLEKF